MTASLDRGTAVIIEWTDADEVTDTTVQCSDCDAVCCRLTVIVFPEDRVPRWMVEVDDHGLEVMAHGEDGWCVALDSERMCCSIYESRPESCRRFVMGAGYCREEREDYRNRFPPIPSVLVDR